MAVRWHMQKLERSNNALPEDMKQAMKGIMREIDKTGW